MILAPRKCNEAEDIFVELDMVVIWGKHRHNNSYTGISVSILPSIFEYSAVRMPSLSTKEKFSPGSVSHPTTVVVELRTQLLGKTGHSLLPNYAVIFCRACPESAAPGEGDGEGLKGAPLMMMVSHDVGARIQ